MSSESIFELEERFGRLLGSQREFIFSPERFGVLAGGYGSGKTKASCIKGLILSAIFDGNVGIVGRYRSTDLEDSTMPVFFETCPPSWIRHWDKQRKVLTLKNYSRVLFRHIHDPNAKGKTKSRRVGANLGWFFIDQLEECDIEHWETLIGRLRRPGIKRKFGFGACNPDGKNWIYKLFFQGFEGFKEGEFFRPIRSGQRLGIAVRSEENKLSNGGFVDDDYFENLRTQYPPEWQARYLDCSFEDFTGKIFKGYTLNSIHNINPFVVPSHYPHIVAIDVGGSTPWAVTDTVVDELGNLVTIQEFYRAQVTSGQVAQWIKDNIPSWNSNDTTFIIDWENKVASMELAEHDIHCRPARKERHPGIVRLQGYVHPRKDAPKPSWFNSDDQPPEILEKAESIGLPRWFVFRSCSHTRAAFDEAVWDENTGKPKKQPGDHPVDDIRYTVMSIPQAARPISVNSAMERLKKTSPASYREWKSLEKRREARMRAQHGEVSLEEALAMETAPVSQYAKDLNYDW